MLPGNRLSSCLMKARFCSVLALVSAGAILAGSSDWPQWRGPSKNSEIAPGKAIEWSKLSDSKIAWEINVGIGYSSLSVVDGRAYTMGHDGKDNETIYCLDAKTGKEIWTHSYPAKLMPAMHVGGPNATPTVHEGAVYVMSKDGQIFALDADKGQLRWSANLEELLGIKTPTWGYASSPVVLGERVLFSAGRVVALDRNTGKMAWISENTYHPGYATPVVFENGTDSILAAFDGKGVSLHHALSGEEIARHGFKTQYDMTATDPIVAQDGEHIFVSSMSQGELLKFDGSKLASVWSGRSMRNSMNASTLLGGHLYGVDGRHKSNRSRFACVRLSDGETVWAKEDFGYATQILVGEHLVVLSEAGELVVVAPSTEGYREVSRKKVLDSICWTPPSYADGLLFVRNDVGRALAVQLH